MGARLRLKASFNETSYPETAQVILRALKKYGAIVADNGSSWFISGAPHPSFDNDVLHTLQNVKGSDFEFVDASSLMVDPELRPGAPLALTGRPYSTFSRSTFCGEPSSSSSVAMNLAKVLSKSDGLRARFVGLA